MLCVKLTVNMRFSIWHFHMCNGAGLQYLPHSLGIKQACTQAMCYFVFVMCYTLLHWNEPEVSLDIAVCHTSVNSSYCGNLDFEMYCTLQHNRIISWLSTANQVTSFMIDQFLSLVVIESKLGHWRCAGSVVFTSLILAYLTVTVWRSSKICQRKLISRLCV